MYSMCADVQRGQIRVSDSLKLVVVSHLMWVLATKLRSSARIASVSKITEPYLQCHLYGFLFLDFNLLLVILGVLGHNSSLL